MCKGDNVRISAKQKEFAETLARINCKRSVTLAIGLSVVIPLLGTLGITTKLGLNTTPLLAMLIVCEMLQLIALPLLIYVVKKNETDLMPISYRVYHLVTFASLIVLSACELRSNGSLLLLAGTMTAYLLAPVISRVEQRVYALAGIIAAVATCIIVAPNGARAIVDSAMIILTCAFFGNHMHEKNRQFERIRGDLKEKTASSEQDPLTGLANRRGLLRRASVLWPYCARANSSVGIIAIDIDFFKKYNDKFGHPEGDRCLKKIADAIKDSARRGTDITARTGGEEFLVFVQDMEEEDLVALALKIRKNIAELEIPHAYVGVSQYVTVSMGIASTHPSLENSFQKLYEEADQALYSAKENGRNCIVSGNLVYGRMKNAFGTVING